VSDTPGVQQILATNSVCPEIPFKGKTYTVGQPDGEARKRLEKLVKKVAIDEVRALKDTLDAAAYAELFATRTASLKHYNTWRPGWQGIVFDPANAHLFLWSLLQAHHPNVTEAEVLAIGKESPEEVAYALAQVVPDFFTMLLAGLEMTPDQQATMQLVMEKFRARLTPTASESKPSKTAA
jgi:hypothetical protein